MSPPAISQSVSQLLGTVLAILAIIVCCNYGGGVWAEETDIEAMAECHRLHNGTIHSSSNYLNQYCFLVCQVNDTGFGHNLNNGMRCPSAESDSYICHDGACVKKPAHNGLTIVSATLSTPINGYVTACLINTAETVRLPMRNRSKCVDCVTRIQVNTANPIWNYECASFYQKISSNNSKVVLELWSNNGLLKNDYQGGAIIIVPKLVNQPDFNSKLEGGIVDGLIKTHLSWKKE